ncbi:hypothetical protein H0H92_015052 [Tricholoma furcatifolium]|nr:hypothetical protein H0H92_015052 [Tricholoma furcatifolium]
MVKFTKAAVEQMQLDLHATSAQISWSLSSFIVIQGLMPLVWSAISEMKGRKVVYIISLALFTMASIVVATSRHVALVIGFRCLQGAGSSAVMNIGAATLADLFEPSERGTKMGMYYIAYLIGPSIGPVLGGVLSAELGWRAIFWFLTIFSGTVCLCFVIFFRDTFRKERSLTYQNLLQKQLEKAEVKREELKSDNKKDAPDIEKGTVTPEVTVTVTFRDVNPAKVLIVVLSCLNNIVTFIASGLFFALGYLVPYTTSRLLGLHYNYDPLIIGFIVVSYGVGSVAGSLLGGRFSDYELARLKAANGNVGQPEMRLKSATYSAFLLPAFVLAFGWICEQRLHVAAICVMLFFCGFLSIWTYASILAYIVDCNPGRSSAAVATNSAFRGISAFIAIEIAVPLQDGLGDGWTYTLWAALMMIGGVLVLLVAYSGEGWRQNAEKDNTDRCSGAGVTAASSSFLFYLPKSKRLRKRWAKHHYGVAHDVILMTPRPWEMSPSSTTSADVFSGHSGHLTNSQQEALEGFKANLLKSELYTAPTDAATASHDDPTLLRFLRARGFALGPAHKQFSDTERWRKEHDVVELYRTFDPVEFEAAKRFYPRWTGRRDKNGIPLYVYRLASLAPLQKELDEVAPQRRYQRIIALYECMVRFAFPLCSSLPHPSPSTPITSATSIIDLEHVAIGSMWHLRSHLAEASRLATANYPETLNTIVIVNSPSFFSTIWGWIKGWFDEGTRKKIHVLGKDPGPTLRDLVHIQDLPKPYGGELEWKFEDEPNLDDAAQTALGGTMPKGPVIFVEGAVVKLSRQ